MNELNKLRARIAEIIYGDGDELPWHRCVQIADTIIWEVAFSA